MVASLRRSSTLYQCKRTFLLNSVIVTTPTLPPVFLKLITLCSLRQIIRLMPHFGLSFELADRNCIASKLPAMLPCLLQFFRRILAVSAPKSYVIFNGRQAVSYFGPQKLCKLFWEDTLPDSISNWTGNNTTRLQPQTISFLPPSFLENQMLDQYLLKFRTPM